MSSVHFGFLRCLPRHEVGSSGSFTGAIFDCVVLVGRKNAIMDESNLMNEIGDSITIIDYYLIVNLNLVNCKRVAKNRYAMVSLPKGRVFYQA